MFFSITITDLKRIEDQLQDEDLDEEEEDGAGDKHKGMYCDYFIFRSEASLQETMPVCLYVGLKDNQVKVCNLLYFIKSRARPSL